MSTQKKDNNPVKGQPQPPTGNKGNGNPVRKGTEADEKRKDTTATAKQHADDRKRTEERGNDTKRPANTNPKNR